MDLTTSWVGIAALATFVLAYVAVIGEEFTHLRKSKPVMLGAGMIWAIIAFEYAQRGMPHEAETAVRHFLVEFAELFLFLLAAMTYVNAMSERNVFDSLRTWLVNRHYTYRQLFWITGITSFFLSPVIDNLTTALVMCAVVMAVGKNNERFVALSCINIVVAANAGGAFSPFGDITTLMVWQKGLVDFWSFFALLLPSLVNYLVPAMLMSLALGKERPEVSDEVVVMKRGARRVIALFFLTITTAVCFHNFLHLPPFLGMMTGLAYLKFFGYYLRRTHIASPTDSAGYGEAGDIGAFDSFREVARAEWDTLFFFFGVIMCVGGLGFIGYLDQLSSYLFVELGPTVANILVGLMSAVIDNIPVMVAVLQMNPQMDVQQWLLVTLTAGVGGSLLSIGSAAGVALMGQARGRYTFFGHLKWTPAVALGFGLSIWVHMLVNGDYAGVMPPGCCEAPPLQQQQPAAH
ncbi:MAG: sodium:proton antiporter NhaD [Pseudomonadales bacterium]|jgi:NhaD family Na+/H+ antiporter|nr:sodium:proton antiporter NhaD [Gammaproteobacteria bacterium]MBP6052553.1 sodium:proton antiporter NhaD [Pseudomonadales bacterium]MBK6582059.1 sodium:proton antiporter NhaD [Gammaproteobacteria bacterium]MBK7521668.1 sodium:proton antiporter NhaD [Gammaproteobacteria bacterium]MBK8307526.1 sodium:proton antiporter NhaD [Gammaproteobacteria bacterium]